jgi:hypothetical protein
MAKHWTVVSSSVNRSAAADVYFRRKLIYLKSSDIDGEITIDFFLGLNLVADPFPLVHELRNGILQVGENCLIGSLYIVGSNNYIAQKVLGKSAEGNCENG